jgi:hypothetical protein
MIATHHTPRLAQAGWWRPRPEGKLPQITRFCTSNRPEGTLGRKESAPAVNKGPLARLASSRLVRSASLLTIVTMVVAGTLDLVAPQSAAAFAVTSHGSPGFVGVPPAILEYGNYGTSEVLKAPARYIYESPLYASRDQHVCITHHTWERVGINSFTLRDAQTRCGWIHAAETRILDGPYTSSFQPLWMTYVAYDVVVSWGLPNGVPIGDKAVRYEVGDGYNMDLRCKSNLSCWPNSDEDVIALPGTDRGLNG